MEAIKERRWSEAAGLSDRERALCAIADKMSAEPTRMTLEDWQPLRDLGFDDEASTAYARWAELEKQQRTKPSPDRR